MAEKDVCEKICTKFTEIQKIHMHAHVHTYIYIYVHICVQFYGIVRMFRR